MTGEYPKNRGGETGSSAGPSQTLIAALNRHRWVTDGGLETTLVFHEGIDLPHFAAFDLLRSAEGTAALRRYYERYARLAGERGIGLIIDTPTWRAQPDWAPVFDYDEAGLVEANQKAAAMLDDIRQQWQTARAPILVSGCIGPRGDAYLADGSMSPQQAADYHRFQIRALAEAGVDLITALTLNHIDEAIGMSQAAYELGVPLVLAFTVETDGRLPGGQALGAAIEAVDAASASYPVHYMINCAHPSHFADTLVCGGDWTDRIGGLRANASRMSHAELDQATALDDGDPLELARELSVLSTSLGGLRVVGGCCGTDHRHIEAIARQMPPQPDVAEQARNLKGHAPSDTRSQQ